ncbi:MAG: helix-turn-helix transcriptional regulator [Clostridia bacterium]|nr:helix-turn-helix transcriptional regulator [Clostridia bacterium]
MEDLKRIVANNLTELRRSAKLTQLELAERLNYSDKAVSKWESGASLPDVTVLYEISKLYGVSVDYLLSEEHKIPVREVVKETMVSRRHFIITLMSVVLVWLVATAAFVILTICDAEGMLWLSFVWAVPVSATVVLVLNSVWRKRRQNYIFSSVLLWTLLASVYLTLLEENLWLIFLIGIPVQIIIGLGAGMRKRSE